MRTPSDYSMFIAGVASNFFRLSSTQVKTQGVEYDYGSLMHYSAYAFSSNGRPTIEPRDARVSTYTLGQRRRFSARDLEHATALYCNSGKHA